MSLLNKLHKKLYQKDSDLEDRKVEENVFDPLAQAKNYQEKQFNAIQESLSSGEDKKSNAEENKPASAVRLFIEKNKKLLIIGASTFAFVVLVVGGVLAFAKYKESLFDPEKVSVKLEGTENIESGSQTDYRLVVKNSNKTRLLNAQIKLNFSRELTIVENPYLSEIQFSSAKINFGTLEKGEEKKYDISFNVFGSKDVQGYVEATLSYSPENFSSSFESKNQVGFLIKSSILELTLVPTREAASGELVEIQAILENKGNSSFENLAIQAEYPMGFSFSQSQPEPSEKNNYWKIDKIEPKEQQKIIINGSLTGELDSLKVFLATLGQVQSGGNLLALTKSEGIIKITTSRLQLTNLFGGNTIPTTVKADETLTIRLNFKNTSNEPLRDLVLIEKISSPVIDKASFIVRDGFYDSAKEQIIWKASQVAALNVLNPGEEGQVSFNFRIKEKFPMENEKDKNFILNIQPEIESLDIDSPLGKNKKVLGDKLAIKVASKVALDVTGSYSDGELLNQGPFPMVTGEKTTLTMRLNLFNTSNDLKDAVMLINLPAGISWENNFLPKDEKMEFDARTNQLIWKLGTISAGTGFILPIRDLAFQISITPSANQTGPSLATSPLFASIKINALDSFTGEKAEYSFREFKVGQLGDY